MAILNPETDRTFMRIEDFIFRVGMEEGKTGKEEEINNQAGR